jgi:hypothetical protein
MGAQLGGGTDGCKRGGVTASRVWDVAGKLEQRAGRSEEWKAAGKAVVVSSSPVLE